MIRKAALVGCPQGPWIALHSIPVPHLRVKGEEGTLVAINHTDSSQSGPFKPGVHEFKQSDFINVFVVCGDPLKALCDVLSEKVA